MSQAVFRALLNFLLAIYFFGACNSTSSIAKRDEDLQEDAAVIDQGDDAGAELAPDSGPGAPTQSTTPWAALPERSLGCGKPAKGTGSYVRQVLQIAGKTRANYVWIP